MAVEARHLSFFPSQLLTNREVMMQGVNEVNPTTIYNNGTNSIGYVAPPLSGTTTETLHPLYYNSVTSRKRSRDSVNPMVSFPVGCQDFVSNNISNCSSFGFLGEDMSLRIQQQQFEIEQFISQHTEKVKMEIEERRKRHGRRILMAVEEVVMKRIRAREEEIENMGKLNWALEEKVKSLYMENQIWRDLAQNNEATVNTLRCNLEQVLSVVTENRRREVGGGGLDVDDGESCCGSTNNENEVEVGEEEELVEVGQQRRRTAVVATGERMCRNCCREEASVLLLPCRHLCLCSVCGSSVHVCPICKATKNASVHINLSSY